MYRLAVRPQPLGIFPLPAGYLVLPPAEASAEALATLLRGHVPTDLPPRWRFLGLALTADTAGALAALAADDSLEACYNRFVLRGDSADYRALRSALTGDLALLLEIAAYTLGYAAAPPDPGAAGGELCALTLMAHAAHAFEQEHLDAAETALEAAFESARDCSPLFAAQLLATRAEVCQRRYGPDPLAVQHYRDALRLLDGAGLAETRAQIALNLGMLYQELARGQRGPLLEAVKCYQEALRVFTRAAFPELYALAQNNLALAYLAMPLTEASDQLRMAIAVQALRETLTVYTRESNPERWSSAQLNLANALQYLPSARPDEHLVEAVQIYEELLQIRDPASDALGYARLLANQGNALAHLGIFAHAQLKLAEARRIFAAAGDGDAATSVDAVLSEIAARLHATERRDEHGIVPAPAV